jgi:hypothetical protein
VVTTCSLRTGPQVWCCYFVVGSCCNVAAGAGLLVGNHIVDASSLVSLYPFLV